jgi:hypothetical protein
LHVANESFENMGGFKYFGTTQTDENCLYEEGKFGGRMLPFSSESFVFLFANPKHDINEKQ